MPRTQSCLRKPGNALDERTDDGNSAGTAQNIRVLDGPITLGHAFSKSVGPQGDPLLQKKWRGDPCGEGRVPQLGLLRRKQNLPHQVGKPAQSPILICQVRLSNTENTSIQSFWRTRDWQSSCVVETALIRASGAPCRTQSCEMQASLGPTYFHVSCNYYGIKSRASVALIRCYTGKYKLQG